MKAKIVSSFFTAVTMAMCCLSVNVSAETESPVTNVTVVEQQYLAGSAKTDISKLTFGKIGNKVYTGKELKPYVTIKNGSTKLKSGTDYTISYKNNKKIGTATITIKGKGNYIGTKRLTFNIVPGKTAVSADRSDDKISLTWDKIKGATGYQLYYSENGGKFSKLKTTTKTSFSTTKLSKDSSFQFKVRAYSKVNGKTYYGNFSDIVEISKEISADATFVGSISDNSLIFTLQGINFDKLITYCENKDCECVVQLAFKDENFFKDYISYSSMYGLDGLNGCNDRSQYSIYIYLNKNSIYDIDFTRTAVLPWNSECEIEWDGEKNILFGKLTRNNYLDANGNIKSGVCEGDNVTLPSYMNTEYWNYMDATNLNIYVDAGMERILQYTNRKEVSEYSDNLCEYKDISVVWQ